MTRFPSDDKIPDLEVPAASVVPLVNETPVTRNVEGRQHAGTEGAVYLKGVFMREVSEAGQFQGQGQRARDGIEREWKGARHAHPISRVVQALCSISVEWTCLD